MKQPIIVIGGGGHARVLISVLQKTNWRLVGYTDPQDRGAILGVPYLGNDGILPELLSRYDDCSAVLGLGKLDASTRRTELQEEIKRLGFGFPVIISPQAVVNAEVELGAGTVAFDGAVVNTGTVTGNGCILNTHSTIDHDCRLGDGVHVAPSATLNGGVTIGDDCLVGTGATVAQCLNVCGGCIIGAGATVIRDIQTPGVYVGVPARRIRGFGVESRRRQDHVEDDGCRAPRSPDA